jgi:L-methionine (R)-S-oxide reductase
VDKEAKRGIYDEAIRELQARFLESRVPTARMATATAVLHSKLRHFFWTGFYLLDDGQLTVGPYQGAPACVVLEPHRGVCWAGIDRGAPIVVPDVHRFEGHIECDGRANSEIVVPLRDPAGEIIGVLDVDSADFDAFDEVDEEKLEEVLALIFG